MASLRFSVRQLLRRRASTLGVLVLLGLPMAICSSLFAIVDSAFLRPLPFDKPEQIVRMEAPLSRFAGRREAADGLREAAEASGLIHPTFVKHKAVFQEGGGALTAMGLRPVFVSPSFFELFGVAPVVGRSFEAADVNARPRRVILSYGVWRDHYRMDRSLIDRPISIEGALEDEHFVLVGVMPAGFGFPNRSNLWLVYSPGDFAGPSLVPDFARLPPSTTVDTLRARLPQATILGLPEYVRPGSAEGLAFILVNAMLLVLVAWVQVAALVQVRAFDKVDDLGVRLALGATRVRILLETLAEGAVLSVASGAFALVIALPLTFVITSRLPMQLNAGDVIRPDLRVFFFACSLQIAGLLLWSLSATSVTWHAKATGATRGLREGLASRLNRTRFGFFAVQVAVTTTVVMLSAAALKSYEQIRSVDVGFDPKNLASFALPPPTFRSTSEVSQSDGLRYQRLASESLAKVRQLEDVIAASFATHRPMGLGLAPRSVVLDESTNMRTDLVVSQIGRGFPATLGARLLEGRDALSEETETRRVDGTITRFALVNQTLARLLEKRGPVLGQQVHLSPNSICEVIGVVGDIHDETPDGRVLPTIYPYLSDRSSYGLVMLVRLRHPSSAARVQRLLQETWGDARQTREVVFLSDVVDQVLAEDRGRWQLLAAMTVLCLLVTFSGVASAIAHSIQHTSKQLAIRLALGATPGRLLRGLVFRTLGLAALGMACGLVAGHAVVRGSTKLFPGLVAQDFEVVAFATVLVALVVGGAALWAGRVVRDVNPSALLRAGL